MSWKDQQGHWEAKVKYQKNVFEVYNTLRKEARVYALHPNCCSQHIQLYQWPKLGLLTVSINLGMAQEKSLKNN